MKEVSTCRREREKKRAKLRGGLGEAERKRNRLGRVVGGRGDCFL